LTIKQSLKFLYPFCFSYENKGMFGRCQSNKIFYPVISLYSIQMMYYPAFREIFAISLFPNQYVFKNIIRILLRSRMGRCIDIYVSLTIYASTTFPEIVPFSRGKANSLCLPKIFNSNFTGTTPTKSSIGRNLFATHTLLLMVMSIFTRPLLYTLFMVKIVFPVIFGVVIILFHNCIIAFKAIYVNAFKRAKEPELIEVDAEVLR